MQKKRSKAPIVVEIIFMLLMIAALVFGIICLVKSVSKENSALTVEGDKTTVIETASDAYDYITKNEAELNLSDSDSVSHWMTKTGNEYNCYIFYRYIDSDFIVLERNAVVTSKENNTLQYVISEFGEDRVSAYEIAASNAAGYIQYEAMIDDEAVNLLNQTFNQSYSESDYYNLYGACIAYYDGKGSYETAVLIYGSAGTEMYWLICDTSGQEVMYSGNVALGFDISTRSSVDDDDIYEKYEKARQSCWDGVFKSLYGTEWSEFFDYAQPGFCKTTILWIVAVAASAVAVIIILICLIVTCVKYKKAGAAMSAESEHNNGNWNENDAFGDGDMDFISAGRITFQCREYLNYELCVKEGEQIRMGKDPKRADFIVPIKYKHVSRQHCMITYSGLDGHFYITDYSSNGTYVNDNKIPKNTAIRLDDYAKVALSKDGFEFIVNN